ncbi:MAG: chitobiase/beta-hexosaminidase C-terminal domain-containing protein [Patescibacteria group bacterium]
MISDKFLLIMFLFGAYILYGFIFFARAEVNNLSEPTSGVFKAILMAEPSVNPEAGVYSSAQTATFFLPSGAERIKYTTNGTDPSCSNEENIYTNPVPISSSLTIKAVSCYPENYSSSIASFVYTINIPSSGGGGGGGYYIYSPTPVATTTQTSSSATTSLSTDINKDSKIDILDFNLLMVNWGNINSGNVADVNKDNKVDLLDFNMLMVYWAQ